MHKIHRLALVAAFFIVHTSLSAHPHVWVDVYATLTGSGRSAAVDIIWDFDPMFSSSMLLDYDTNRDNYYDGSESQKVYVEAFEHLIAQTYFSAVLVNGRQVTTGTATRFQVLHEDGQMQYRFRLPINASVSASDSVSVVSYDPSFFIDYLMKPAAGQSLANETVEIAGVQMRNVETLVVNP